MCKHLSQKNTAHIGFRVSPFRCSAFETFFEFWAHVLMSSTTMTWSLCLCSLFKLHISRCGQVSLLLKDSFIDSFSSREQAFIKVFWIWFRKLVFNMTASRFWCGMCFEILFKHILSFGNFFFWGLYWTCYAHWTHTHWFGCSFLQTLNYFLYTQMPYFQATKIVEPVVHKRFIILTPETG